MQSLQFRFYAIYLLLEMMCELSLGARTNPASSSNWIWKDWKGKDFDSLTLFGWPPKKRPHVTSINVPNLVAFGQEIRANFWGPTKKISAGPAFNIHTYKSHRNGPQNPTPTSTLVRAGNRLTRVSQLHYMLGASVWLTGEVDSE